jgi:uncharacterized membrane protein YbaN (DUF454 family)
MKKHVKRLTIQTIGYACLMLGVAGILLPVLNGIIFLILGLVLLSVYSARAKTLLHRLGRQHPKAEQTVIRVERWVLKMVGE